MSNTLNKPHVSIPSSVSVSAGSVLALAYGRSVMLFSWSLFSMPLALSGIWSFQNQSTPARKGPFRRR
jgi:hypothetical protein